jgi:fructokinase
VVEAAAGDPVVAVAGEVVTDLVPVGTDGLFRAVPGGSPANVAVGLSRLGVPTYLLARLSQDALGRRLREHLAGNGVLLDRSVAVAEPSSLAVVTVGPDGSAEYDFRVDGTADWQWTDDELRSATDGLTALHVGSLAAFVPPGAEALERLVERTRGTVTVSFDPNIRPVLVGPRSEAVARVERLVRLVDVVKASAEDVSWLYPGSSLDDVAARWLGAGPALVVLTRGGEGVAAVGTASGPVVRPALPVEVRDTVGAGDAFMSGLLAGLAGHRLLGPAGRSALAALGAAEVSELLDEAALVAAITCTRQGADPPTRAEVEEAYGP